MCMCVYIYIYIYIHVYMNICRAKGKDLSGKQSPRCSEEDL